MKKYILIALTSLTLLFGGCSAYRNLNNLGKQEQRIEQLSEQIVNLDLNTRKILEEQQANIDESVADRISVGGAQAVAVLGTLNANPIKDDYTIAGIKGLNVTENALRDRIYASDLIDAIKTQNLLLSKQADQIAEGDRQLGIANDEINKSKAKELEIQRQKEEVEKKAEEDKAKLAAKIADEQKKYQDHLNQVKKDAAKTAEDNVWYNKINPFRDFFSGIGKLLIWGVVFIVLGLILRLLSIIFPQVNIIQVFVKSIGRIFGVVIKALFGWIPDVLRGMNAVDYEKFKQEKTLNENTIGAVQEFKEKNPEEYKALLKSRLEEWNKENPELVGLVEEKLKILNLK